MNLQMNPAVAAGYKSRSQIARVVTEDWCLRNLYCPACDSPQLSSTTPNTRAVDFQCPKCDLAIQLKSGARWSKDRIPDAGYDAMRDAIRSGRAPSLLVLQYTSHWTVQNMLLVPSFFFIESAVEPRRPLSPTARRAGWVGCNIRLSAIARDGKIKLVDDSIAASPSFVREEYQRIRPIAKLRLPERGWTLEVLRMIRQLGKRNFTSKDARVFQTELAVLYPRNRNVPAKIRQQLQVLRDLGFLEFTARGCYEVL